MFSPHSVLPTSVQSLLGMKKVEHTIQVTSFGGCGTTLLYRFLEKHEANVPEGHDWLPWKHASPPPEDADVPDGFRALYVFGNPMNAVLSVFRRNFQHWHARNMRDDLSDWNDDWELEDFLQQEKDPFHMQEHFRSWTTARRDYPIMLLKFDALWQRLPEVFAFLGLPSRLLADFPERRERDSDWTEHSASVRQSLQRLYGGLHDEVDAFPELKII